MRQSDRPTIFVCYVIYTQTTKLHWKRSMAVCDRRPIVLCIEAGKMSKTPPICLGRRCDCRPAVQLRKMSAPVLGNLRELPIGGVVGQPLLLKGSFEGTSEPSFQRI